jgi:hypothetical protein
MLYKAKLVTFPKLCPSTETTSLRIFEAVMSTIGSHARRLDVSYPLLIQLWCTEKASEPVYFPQTAHRGSR